MMAREVPYMAEVNSGDNKSILIGFLDDVGLMISRDRNLNYNKELTRYVGFTSYTLSISYKSLNVNSECEIVYAPESGVNPTTEFPIKTLFEQRLELCREQSAELTQYGARKSVERYFAKNFNDRIKQDRE
jgi:hypothetical protein